MIYETANDRLKRSSRSIFWESIILATVIHFAILAYWPDVQAENISFTMDEIEAVELPPEIEIPPPPEVIARPASPVIVTGDIDLDQTMPTTIPEMFPEPELLPPAPDSTGVDATRPGFTPMTVRPEVRNRAEVERALQQQYPSILRDNGIGGTVLMHFFIDEEGVVQNFLVAEPSEYPQLDDAALRVADVIEFTPAMNREEQVPVWIRIPITFQTN